jgi:hypothetical protein
MSETNDPAQTLTHLGVWKGKEEGSKIQQEMAGNACSEEEGEARLQEEESRMGRWS